MSCRVLIVALILVGVRLPAGAHNGAQAVAETVSAIVVDGDLSDWPPQGTPHSVGRVEFGQPPVDAADFSGHFRLGYDPGSNRLYLAVEITDDSWIAGAEGDGWDERDGCEVYLGRGHSDDAAATQFVVRGDQSGEGSPTPWRSVVASGDMIVAVATHGTSRVYEWRLDLGEEQGSDLPRTQSLDVAICDLDADGSFSWVAWGAGIVKVLAEDRRGDAVLTAGSPTGRLRGVVAWGDRREGMSLGRIEIQDPDSDLAVRVRTDEEGRYEVELPAGRYTIEAGYRRTRSPAIRGQVEAGRTSWAAQISFERPPLGVVSRAGKGRRVKAGAGTRRGPWHTISALDGLPSPVINDLLQDRHGFVWLATDGGGVARYDGHSFLHLDTADGLPSDRVVALVEAPDGALWLSTWGAGISRYDGGEFVSYTTADGLASDWVWDIAFDSDGDLWIATEGGGVSRWDGDGFHTYGTEDGLSDDRVATLLPDPAGGIWFGGLEGGVTRYREAEIRSFAGHEGEPLGVRSMAAGRDGTIWFAGGQLSIARFSDGAFARPSLAPPFDGRSVEAALVDEESVLWLGTSSRGVWRWDGHSLQSRTTQHGLASNRVTAILEDREGGLWFGSGGAGVSRYEPSSFRSLTVEDGLPDNSTSFALPARSGAVWIGTLEGLVRYDDGQMTTFTEADGLPANWVRSACEDSRGSLWVGTHRGLARLDRGHFTTPAELAAVSGSVNFIFEDGTGNLWFGLDREGLLRWDGRDMVTLSTRDGLPSNRVWSMLQDQSGLLWFATLGGGFVGYDGQGFSRFSRPEGLPDDTVHDLMRDRRGDLWLATALSGVVRYDGETFEALRTADGLAHNTATCLLETRQGHIWVGTEGGGASRYDGEVLQSLLRRDGLAGNSVRSLAEDSAGDVWLATDAGVSIYGGREIEPVVQLTGIAADRRYAVDRPLQISTGQLVVFEFRGISFRTRPGQLVYRYRLEGHDPGWRQTRETRVEYGDVEAGDYLFSVQAVDRDLMRSALAEVRLTVAPDYAGAALRTGAAVGLLGLLMATGFGLRQRAERQRDRQALAEQERLRAHEEEIRSRLEAENVYLQDEIKLVHNFEQIVTQSEKLRLVLRDVEQVASTEATVLVLGESGTGKELIARALHGIGPRKSRPLVKVNCAALPANLIESELFGHEKGAFTGAVGARAGRFELADGGTIFLDEIGEVPLELQPKLLRVLQEGEFERLGGSRTTPVDVRVIAATNRDLQRAVREGTFREDLFFRINVFPIRVPPLRERVEDIPLLVSSFVKKYATKVGRQIDRVPKAAIDRLQAYPWPGNVRELENVIERAVILSSGPELTLGDWIADTADAATGPLTTLAENEREHICRALVMTGGQVSGERGAARLLVVNPKTLASRMKRLGIGRDGKPC